MPCPGPKGGWVPREPEIMAAYLMEVRGPDGHPVKIGAGSTDDGEIVIIQPPGGMPTLSVQAALGLTQCIRRAIIDAAARH